jgi:hypothetical protein
MDVIEICDDKGPPAQAAQNSGFAMVELFDSKRGVWHASM